MPPWIYSNGFWANLREVMFPHQWLAARTAGVDLTRVDDGSGTVGHAGTEQQPATGEDGLADGKHRMSLGHVGADRRPAGTAARAESHVTRRHVHMLNGDAE